MKAILVIDMPEKCKHCDLYREDKYADYICMATLEYVDGDKISKNCPLKPIPTHVIDRNTFAIENKYANYQDGYNECIDEILGGNDE